MHLPDFFARLDPDVLRQLDEEGWFIAEEGQSSLRLVRDRHGLPGHCLLELLLRDDELTAVSEVCEAAEVVRGQRCTSTPRNLSNLVDVALGLVREFEQLQ